MFVLPLQADIRKYPHSVISRLKSKCTTGRVCPLHVNGICRKFAIFFFRLVVNDWKLIIYTQTHARTLLSRKFDIYFFFIELNRSTDSFFNLRWYIFFFLNKICITVLERWMKWMNNFLCYLFFYFNLIMKKKKKQ